MESLPKSNAITGEILVTVAEFRYRRRAEEHMLVLLAAGIPCQITRTPRSYCLQVDPPAQEKALYELQLYARDPKLQRWKTYPLRAPSFPQMLSLIFYILSVLFIFYLQGKGVVTSEDWGVRGKKILEEGEWWRVFTGLWLHSGFSHAGMNLAMGSLYMCLLFRFGGIFTLWTQVLLAGGLGNLLTISIYYPNDHWAIGASTMVFGMLGVLIGYEVGWGKRGGKKKKRERRSWVIIGGGLGLLAFFGVGGENTDIFAHLFGFIAGLGVSLISKFGSAVIRHRF